MIRKVLFKIGTIHSVKILGFLVTQILREINFGASKIDVR